MQPMSHVAVCDRLPGWMVSLRLDAQQLFNHLQPSLSPLTPHPHPSQPVSQPASAQQQPEHSSHIWPPTPSQLLALVITHKPRVLLLSPPSLMISPLLGSKPEKHGAHRRHLESRAERGVCGWFKLVRVEFSPEIVVCSCSDACCCVEV